MAFERKPVLLRKGIRALQRLEILLEPALLPVPCDGVGDADFDGMERFRPAS